MTAADTAGPKVVVADVGVDAALFQEDERPVVVLRPGQTFTSAVRAMQRVLPNMHPDQIRRLIRKHLPAASDFDDYGTVSPARATRPGPRVPGSVKVAMLAVGVLMICGAYLLGTLDHNVHVVPPAAKEPGGLTVEVPLQRPLFTGPVFTAAAKAGAVCEPVNALAQRCMDTDGATVDVSVSLADGGRVTYVCVYGIHKIAVADFGTAEAAAAFTKSSASSLMPNAYLAGEYVIWGSDNARIAHWLQLLGTTPAKARL